jgi:hypothetical protein
LKLDPTIDLPAEDKAASPDTMWVEYGTLTDDVETNPLLHTAITVRLVQVDCMIFISSWHAYVLGGVFPCDLVSHTALSWRQTGASVPY